jgi:phosphoesterase RecJ-like protein
MMSMQDQYAQAEALISSSSSIVIIQAGNPDADSLGSALALEQILTLQGKDVTLCCSMDIPRHLRYLPGWDRVGHKLPANFDLSIIVDNPAEAPMEAFLTAQNRDQLERVPMLVIDHHGIDVSIEHPKRTDLIDGPAVATGQLIYELVKSAGWKLDTTSGTMIAGSILADSQGLTADKTTARTIYILAELVEGGYVNLTELDKARRAINKKSLAILRYKARLIERLEFYFDNRLAMITIPLEEIKAFSDKYNPPMLVMEELRNVEECDVVIALKTYNDHILGKLRSNTSPICNEIAGHFGGGGHPHASGFNIKGKDPDALKKEIIELVGKLLEGAK